MFDIASVLASAATAFGVALGLLFLANRAGLTDLQREVKKETDRLATALRVRVETLESENKRLLADIDYLKRDNAELRVQLDKLRSYVILHKIEAVDVGA